MPLAQVDTGGLIELVWASALAGLTVAVAFAGVIQGATRAGDARREGRPVAAAAYGGAAMVAATLFLGAIAVGLFIIAA